jgi:predicted O-methyltransferase YrrM
MMTELYENTIIDLSVLVKEAYEIGTTIDLSECRFGLRHSQPTGYYYFLAGLCKVHKLSRILEIGTFMGGSSLAMYLGIQNIDDNPEHIEPKIITLDLEKRQTECIDRIESITKIIGDPLHPETFEEILNLFENQSIDVLFIDASKLGRIVLSQLASFCLFLNPKYIILDDITVNKSMEKMWLKLSKKFDTYSINAPLVLPSIRVTGEVNVNAKRPPGFGVIAYRDFMAKQSQS